MKPRGATKELVIASYPLFDLSIYDTLLDRTLWGMSLKDVIYDPKVTGMLRVRLRIRHAKLKTLYRDWRSEENKLNAEAEAKCVDLGSRRREPKDGETLF